MQSENTILEAHNLVANAPQLTADGDILMSNAKDRVLELVPVLKNKPPGGGGWLD